MIYVQVDENDYVEGWSSSPQENFIGVEKPTEDFQNRFSYYRFDGKNIIFDDTKVLKETKNQTKEKIRNEFGSINRIPITLDGEKLFFVNDVSNKAFLQKSYYLTNDNLINETLFNFIDVNNEIVVKVITKVNINELWLLSFLKDEETNKNIKEAISKIDSCKTMEELIDFKNNFNGGILND